MRLWMPSCVCDMIASLMCGGLVLLNQIAQSLTNQHILSRWLLSLAWCVAFEIGDQIHCPFPALGSGSSFHPLTTLPI